MSALFNFQSFLTLVLLFICTCAYIRQIFPHYINKWYHDGFKGIIRRSAVIGDRLSPYVSGACLFFAAANILLR
eukprot:403377007